MFRSFRRSTRMRIRMPMPMASALLLAAMLALLSLAPLTLSVQGSTVLTPGAEDIESNFPAQTAAAQTAEAAERSAAGYPSRSLSPLKATVTPEAATLLSRAAAAFKATSSSFDLRFDNAVSSPELKAKFLNDGGFDMAVLTQGPVAADYLNMPGLKHYPIQGNAIVFSYNLDTAATGGNVLALRPMTLCNIFRGNITRWNDPAILADNPAMTALVTAGDVPINVLTVTVQTATHYWFSTYCGKIDPAFKAQVPAAVVPAYTAPHTSAYASLDLMNSAVSDTPFSLAVTTWSNAADISLPIGAFINSEGAAILPSSAAVSFNVYELATNGFTFQDNSYDLTNPTTPQAWPVCTMSFLYIDTQRAVTTCSNKRLLQDFILFLYTSEVVASLAESLATTMLPDVFIAHTKLLQRIQTELVCMEEPLFQGSATKGFLPASGLAMETMKLFTSFYLSVDPAVAFQTSALSEELAVQRTIMGEANLAIVNTAALTDKDLALLAEGRTALQPAFFAGVTPTFTLPFELTDFAALPETSDLGLPDLYPIRMNLELLTRIFIGEVTSWLDSGLVALNPQLTAWFNASGAPKILHVVVGATSASDTLSGAKLLFQHMAMSKTALANPWAFEALPATSGPASNPFLPIIARSEQDARRANFTLVDVEVRLPIKVGTMPGAVSYRVMTTMANPSVEFQWVDTLTGATVPSSVQSLKKCASALLTPEGFDEWTPEEIEAHSDYMSLPETQRHWLSPSSPSVGCWPLSTLLSFAVKTTYSTAAQSNACTRGLRALEFINYVSSTGILSLPAESLGLVRLGDFASISALATQTLHGATCDGAVLLIVPPEYWSVGNGLTAFGQAMAILGLIVMTVSLGVVVVYRHKVVIRSSSAPFLIVILLGMALLLAAMLPWSVEASESSCSAFLWLVNLGFMLLFSPLFAKTWRVYRIFSGSHLKVIKISNQKLLAATATVILLDVALVSVWQGVAPLVPVTYERVISSTPHVFTHCSVQSSGAGLVFVGLIAAEKGALLLFGAIMAFSTRNVKGTFNESTAISWSIYNTLMSALIAVAIIVFVSAVEDTLIILVLILLTWIVFSAWGLIFGPKFHLLTQSDEKVIEASRSQITQEKSNGFSFASVAAMTTGQIKQFYIALRLQVNKTERVLQLPQTMWQSQAPGLSTGVGGGMLLSSPEKNALNNNLNLSTGGTGGTGGGRGGSRGLQPALKGSGLHGEGDDLSHLTPAEQAYITDSRPLAFKDRDGLRERGVLTAPSSGLHKPSGSTMLRSKQSQQQAQSQYYQGGAAATLVSPTSTGGMRMTTTQAQVQPRFQVGGGGWAHDTHSTAATTPALRSQEGSSFFEPASPSCGGSPVTSPPQPSRVLGAASTTTAANNTGGNNGNSNGNIRHLTIRPSTIASSGGVFSVSPAVSPVEMSPAAPAAVVSDAGLAFPARSPSPPPPPQPSSSMSPRWGDGAASDAPAAASAMSASAPVASAAAAAAADSAAAPASAPSSASSKSSKSSSSSSFAAAAAAESVETQATPAASSAAAAGAVMINSSAAAKPSSRARSPHANAIGLKVRTSTSASASVSRADA